MTLLFWLSLKLTNSLLTQISFEFTFTFNNFTIQEVMLNWHTLNSKWIVKKLHIMLLYFTEHSKWYIIFICTRTEFAICCVIQSHSVVYVETALITAPLINTWTAGWTDRWLEHDSHHKHTHRKNKHLWVQNITCNTWGDRTSNPQGWGLAVWGCCGLQGLCPHVSGGASLGDVGARGCYKRLILAAGACGCRP